MPDPRPSTSPTGEPPRVLGPEPMGRCQGCGERVPMREVDGMGGHTRSAHDCDGTPESRPIPIHCGPVTPEASNADEPHAEERVRYALSVERRAFAMGAPMMLLHGTADAIEAMCEDVSRLRAEVERLRAAITTPEVYYGVVAREVADAYEAQGAELRLARAEVERLTAENAKLREFFDATEADRQACEDLFHARISSYPRREMKAKINAARRALTEGAD